MPLRVMPLLSNLLLLVIGSGINPQLVYSGWRLFDFIYPAVFGITFGFGMFANSLVFLRTAASLQAGMEEAR
jgi:hypothetical protein